MAGLGMVFLLGAAVVLRLVWRRTRNPADMLSALILGGCGLGLIVVAVA